MKRVFFIFCLLFNLVSYAQYYEIKYEQTKYRMAVVQSLDVLHIGKDKSLYLEGNPKLLQWETEGGKTTLNIVNFPKNRNSFYVIDLSIQKIKYKYYGNYGTYYVEEDLQPMTWVLSEETKSIDGYELQKATTTFRGRNYTAWCRLDIPISFGPWKFHNLPGLAYEITDDGLDSHYEYKLSSFKKAEHFHIYKTLNLNKKMLSLKEFVIQYRKDVRDSGQQSATRSFLDEVEEFQGAIIEDDTDYDAIFNSEKEIKYEWED